MEHVLMIAQTFVGLSILSVWLFRFKKATACRAGAGQYMKEEFAVYGLPFWFMWIVGGLEIIFASSLLVGFWLHQLIQPAAIGMGIIMFGAIVVHIKVGDTLNKMVPAVTLFVLSLAVAISGSRG